MKADISELMSNIEAYEAHEAAIRAKAKEINTSVPDFDVAIRLAAEPHHDARRSRESLEKIVQQNAELLQVQQKQIEENNASGKKSTRLAWIAIIVSVAMTILSIGASVLISIYL